MRRARTRSTTTPLTQRGIDRRSTAHSRIRQSALLAVADSAVWDAFVRSIRRPYWATARDLPHGEQMSGGVVAGRADGRPRARRSESAPRAGRHTAVRAGQFAEAVARYDLVRWKWWASTWLATRFTIATPSSTAVR